MGRILHGNAKITHVVRAAIQQSKVLVANLAEQSDLNLKTVRKWRKWTSVEDPPMGPKEPRSTVLSPEDEAACVAFCKHTLLPSTRRQRRGYRRGGMVRPGRSTLALSAIVLLAGLISAGSAGAQNWDPIDDIPEKYQPAVEFLCANLAPDITYMNGSFSLLGYALVSPKEGSNSLLDRLEKYTNALAKRKLVQFHQFEIELAHSPLFVEALNSEIHWKTNEPATIVIIAYGYSVKAIIEAFGIRDALASFRRARHEGRGFEFTLYADEVATRVMILSIESDDPMEQEQALQLSLASLYSGIVFRKSYPEFDSFFQSADQQAAHPLLGLDDLRTLTYSYVLSASNFEKQTGRLIRHKPLTSPPSLVFLNSDRCSNFFYTQDRRK